MAMTVLGDVAKGALLWFVFFYVLAMIGSAVSGNTVLALFMLVGLLVPAAWIIYGYDRDRRKTSEAP
jgi:hypothetical protein